MTGEIGRSEMEITELSKVANFEVDSFSNRVPKPQDDREFDYFRGVRDAINFLEGQDPSIEISVALSRFRAFRSALAGSPEGEQALDTLMGHQGE